LQKNIQQHQGRGQQESEERPLSLLQASAEEGEEENGKGPAGIGPQATGADRQRNALPGQGSFRFLMTDVREKKVKGKSRMGLSGSHEAGIEQKGTAPEQRESQD
jgi:hypothetical protein